MRYQFDQFFQTVLKEKLQFMGVGVEQFESWARNIGLSLNPNFFPFLQLAVVRLRARSWLQASCQMFSQLWQKAPALPLVGQPDNMPPWHNVLFRNSMNHTYYPPKLLKDTVSLPPTWLPAAVP